ncbi:hypothetical protein NKI31_12245 [Mesorhizobium sp. M0659]|uniref:hypothetical protein n=1 Tax=Mesorhizobium sp. M0659 TaxID=2956980 RepID=UPI003339B2FF
MTFETGPAFNTASAISTQKVSVEISQYLSMVDKGALVIVDSGMLPTVSACGLSFVGMASRGQETESRRTDEA